MGDYFLRLFLSLTLLVSATCAYGQQAVPAKSAIVSPLLTAEASAVPADLPDAPDAGLQQAPAGATGQAVPDKDSRPTGGAKPQGQTVSPATQPKRILGLMPNYKAVSAGEIPPPPTSKESFKIATQNSFDYSAFVFTGLTSLIAEGNDSHEQLGKGVPGFWAYSWRGFVDKTDGNYWVIWALPTVFHEDERYYALGKGSIMKRAGYAVSRVAITPNYQGHNTVNLSELLGRGIAEGISTTYYPSEDSNVSDIATKYSYAILRDAATNAFREFWPDIAVHVLHRKP